MAWLHPSVSCSVRLGEAQEYALLTSSQVLLVLLVQGPHFENYCTKRWKGRTSSH